MIELVPWTMKQVGCFYSYSFYFYMKAIKKKKNVHIQTCRIM